MRINMNKVIFDLAFAIHGGAMEADTISKNGQSSKSHISRANLLRNEGGYYG